MFEKDLNEQEYKKRSHLPAILLVIVAVIVLGGGGLLAWQLLSPSGGNASTPSTGPSTQAQQAAQPPQAASGGGKGTPLDVAGIVRQNIAQKMHLSVGQLQAKLQSGMSIETLGTQQGLSQDQWHTFVLDTYQTAYNNEVSTGKVTQGIADHDMKNIKAYPLSALDDWVTTDCLGK